MTKHTIFSQEKQIIEEAEQVLSDEAYANSPLLPEYRQLAENYKKLFKHFTRIVKINDKQQLQLIESQESILKYNEELKQLNATKDKFFSIISHDLKSPINSFLNVATLLVDHFDRLSQNDIRDMAVSVKKSGTNLLKLLENLLAWSRLQMNRIEFQPIPCDLKRLVDSVVSFLSNQAKEKTIRIESILHKETMVYVDPNMISSVIQNLVSNAIKFTYPDGQITIDSDHKNDFVELTVTDSGIGISPKNLDKLFRLDVIHTGIGTAKERGTGLGLILCKEMVEKHNGRIWVKSEEEKGSTFGFSCPSTEDSFQAAQARL